MATLLLIGAASVAPNLATEGRREKEKEMIWRGKQYVRGIRLYYQKTHRFPAQLDDLYTPKTGIRFMRQPYKDPMNSVDGSWRLIYVAPNGQLIGSLRTNRNAFFFGKPPGKGFAGALSPLSSSLSSDGSGNSLTILTPGAPSLSTAVPSAFSGPFTTTSSTQTPAASGTLNPLNAQSGDSSSSPESAAAPSDDGPTYGQTVIIGVGSKVNRRSVIWLDGAKSYLQFEFIWDGRSSSSANGLVVPSP